MATKVVGVRQLKNQAPELVQRAEQGERFVITRHGRAVATLGPAEPDHALAGGSPRFRQWERERAAFTSMPAALAKRFRGQFVAVSEGKICDSDAEVGALFDRVAGRLGGVVFFIGRVGAAEPVIDMPGFSIE